VSHTPRVQGREVLAVFDPPRIGRLPVDSDLLDELQNLYQAQCDGDWEHQFGVEIGTLDNPGWRLAIDIQGTNLEGRVHARQVIDRSDSDWIHHWSDGKKFEAACGPLNLREAILAFVSFAGHHPDSSALGLS
jgi:hypothetical protein